IRLFVGKIVNDNVNNKVCYYATQPVNNKEYLNLLVASYKPDEFDMEFKQLSNMSYNELRRNPERCPILAADRDYQLKKLRAEDADRGAALHDDDTSDTISSSAIDDNEDDDATDIEGDNPFIDGAAAAEKEAFAAAAAEADDRVYRPIRNVASLAPNVFDSNTTVRILGKRDVFMMPVCPTKNCLYSHEKPSYMNSHIANCRSEPLTRIRQSVHGPNVIDFVHELAADGYLPSAEYAQRYFVTYDIECLMSQSMDFTSEELEEYEIDNYGDDERKYHNIVTIAAMTSDGEKICFPREDMETSSAKKLLVMFINYLLHVRKTMLESLPECITQGIEYYSAELAGERRKAYSIEQAATLSKKLYYLKDFTKLKIYSWCGERYDLTLMFPNLASVLWHFTGEKTKDIKPIKRGNGYMMLDSMGLSFRDFRNYTAPMSLDQLAKSCDLDPGEFSKGSFCYEWYTSVDQLKRALALPAYTCFYSTLYTGAFHRGEFYVDEINAIARERLDSGEWQREDFILELAVWLKLDSLIDDPVLIDRGVNGKIACGKHLATLKRIFGNATFCDRNDSVAREFFRFSPRSYESARALWDEIEDSVEEMSMLVFLMNYNYNDVKLLTACVNAYARSYEKKFELGLHADLSIAKMAQKLAFIQYDKTLPPIYSIPPKAAFFYKDCRKKLLGGICQVFHWLIYLNANADPRIPKTATTAPNGERYKSVMSLDFNSLYPFVVSQDLPLGPGIIYNIESALPKSSSKWQGRMTAGSGYNTTPRFFNEGLFNQKQNTSIESIRWLEYLNWRDYNGRIQHAYNLAEKKVGKYCVDGYLELDDNIPNTTIPKKKIFEFRGCSFHTCPYCKRKPWLGVKKIVKDPETGIQKRVTIEADELRIEDMERIDAILNTLRSEYCNGEDLAPYENFIGPLNLRYHEIIIEYNCRWIKDWCIAEYKGQPPCSPSYPFLYKGCRPERSGSYKPEQQGVTTDDFKRLLRTKNAQGQSSFFGLAVVDLSSSSKVIEENPYIPPIYDKIKLNSDMLAGHMKSLLSKELVDKLYPSEENIFCYNATRYLATSEMLAYYDSKGIDFTLHYFVEYYRGAPFKRFVKNMVRDRVIALSKGNVTMQLVIKLLLNAMVGRFALAVARFMCCRILGADKMLNVIRSPMLKSIKSLRVEDDAVDPLHEVVTKKKRIVEDLALQIQIYVYQDRGDYGRSFSVGRSARFCRR
ncbi:unnamed protein product, partial [Oikopleura dioica]